MPQYKFSNLMGSVYTKGNLAFSPDGYTLISPVGNRISLFDLKDHISKTLPVESSVNITSISLSPNGLVLLAATEIGEVYVISLVSQSALHVLRPGGQIRLLKYSPNGKLFAVMKEDCLLIYDAPSARAVSNPYALKGTYGEKDLRTLDWSYDSKLVVIGSGDGKTHIYPVAKFKNFAVSTYNTTKHPLIGTFFLNDAYEIYNISSDGAVCLLASEQPVNMFLEKSDEKEEQEGTPDKRPRLVLVQAEEKKNVFKTKGTFYYEKLFKKGDKRPPISCVAYNKEKSILVTGFDGTFFIHEMPDFNLIHSLAVSNGGLSTIALNPTADWIACGSSDVGSVMVWEWQSETFILNQQGHQDMIECFAYSPNGLYMATGGTDCKVKIWNTQTSFCFKTFEGHEAPVTGIAFTQKGKAVLSSSLDGTVRAWDLKRYRQFRTFSATRPVQFSCVTVDNSEEFVVAGARSEFGLYLWSLKTGRLLEVLEGHEASVEAVAFSPSSGIGSSRLASVSTDKTLKIWESIGTNGAHENILLSSEGTCLAYSPDGQKITVGTLDGNLSFFNAEGGNQNGSINGRLNLHAGRSLTDKTTAKNSQVGKQFRTLDYSPDGKFLLAAGPAKNICMYSTEHQHLIGSFVITKNQSFDALQGHINRKKIGEFGVMDLVENREDNEQLALPGVRKGDMTSRLYQNELRVTCVRFSPAGRMWAASTTEGLLVYSSESNKLFDPIGADEVITPETIQETIKNGMMDDKAIMMALRLNIREYIRLAYESVGADSVEFIAKELPFRYVKLLLRAIVKEIPTTRRFEFYMIWIEALLRSHLWDIKASAESEVKETLNNLRKNFDVHHGDLAIIEANFNLMSYIGKICELQRDLERVEFISGSPDDSSEEILKVEPSNDEVSCSGTGYSDSEDELMAIE